ncbi:hypothetical protein [Leptospira noguchii]|uniref:hypothetical protein n=1 Tax=Leptospira noguchii TaxID=28182 RepID=UPI001FB7370C|nr:hypothetical protein [Leptospira noguchii]UOG61373.1 hypothetical protein MAL07_04925 [Leptospira noguchii]
MGKVMAHYGSRSGNSAKHSLWVAFWKLSKTLPMGRVLETQQNTPYGSRSGNSAKHSLWVAF